MDILIWFEQSALGVWLRESPSMFAFPLPLTLHAIGMAFLVGSNFAIDIRILGFANSIPLGSMNQVFPIMWFGLVINTLSGIALLVAFPIKAFTNPIFYLKLTFIALAIAVLLQIKKHVRDARPGSIVSRNVKALAGISLFLWVLATTAGRLLAYTYSQLTSQDVFFF
jgi:hypothetical protein